MNLENDVESMFSKMKWNDKFLILTSVLVFFSVIATPLFAGNVFFATRLLKYRCFIPGCDSFEVVPEYRPKWLKYAVPFHENDPEKCTRFVQVGDNDGNSSCSQSSFLTNQTVYCDKYVFAEKYETIAQDFGIYCNENNWKLTLPNAISSIGSLISTTILGFISDCYGRRTSIIFALEFAAISGTLKSFSTSYIMFVILEFIEQMVSGGLYSITIIYACEQVSAKRRTVLVCASNILFSLGEVSSSLIAWTFYSWRHFIRVAFFPAFFAIFFHWLAPESVRWLVSKDRYVEAENNINMKLTERSKNKENPNLILHSIEKTEKSNEESNPEQYLNKKELWNYFSHIELTIRFFVCGMCAFTTYAVYYGMGFYVITFHGNFYFNFALLCLVEIPPNLFSARYLDYWSRKNVLVFVYFLGGLSCVSYVMLFWTKWISLILFIITKLLATVAVTVVDIYITEVFPTTIRGTLVSTCTMLGILGLQLAVQIPILASYWNSLPAIVFAVLLFIAALLCPLLPETLNKTLPENVGDALKLGQKK